MYDAEILAKLRLTSGEPVRFRKQEGGRWLLGKMSGVASDGSITIHDANGAARSLRPERVEVRRPGSRGRLTWQLVSDVAITWEQLALWGESPSTKGKHRRRSLGAHD
ncbi:MAG TPA: hypothetical protein VGC84_03585 [Ilumatobacteraceae bacterium]|jgi:hypothetical protein